MIVHMRKITLIAAALLLWCEVGAAAQTVTIQVQATATTLTGALSNVATTFTVADASPWSKDTPPYTLLVDQEPIRICTSGLTMTVCASGRAFGAVAGQVAAAHLNGATVSVVRTMVLPADATASLAVWTPTKTTVTNGVTKTYDAAGGILKIIGDYFAQTILPQNPGGAVATAQANLAAAQAALLAAQSSALPPVP